MPCFGCGSSRRGSRWINAPLLSFIPPMASSFIPPLDPNPNSPSSKQRRRNAALSCAECRRYIFHSCLATLSNLIVSFTHKTQAEVRPLFALLMSQSQTLLPGAVVSSLVPAALRRAALQSAPKVNANHVWGMSSVRLTTSTGSLTTGKGNRCVFFSSRHENFSLQHVIAVSSLRIPKCFTIRSAFCPTASGSSRMRWRKHILFTTAKDTLFCQTSYCSLNAPWSGNLGTKFHLLRKPRPRKLSTLWGLCQSERTYRSFSLSLSLPGRSPTPVAQTFMARPRIHT